MARIAGVDIPREKRVVIALTYIHGIGPTSARQIVTGSGVSPEPVESRNPSLSKQTPLERTARDVQPGGETPHPGFLNSTTTIGRPLNEAHKIRAGACRTSVMLIELDRKSVV